MITRSKRMETGEHNSENTYIIFNIAKAGQTPVEQAPKDQVRK